jgi:hypothetical protein
MKCNNQILKGKTMKTITLYTYNKMLKTIADRITDELDSLEPEEKIALVIADTHVVISRQFVDNYEQDLQIFAYNGENEASFANAYELLLCLVDRIFAPGYDYTDNDIEDAVNLLESIEFTDDTILVGDDE